MDIAALSMGLSQMKVQTSASILTMKKSMDTVDTQTQAMIQMMGQASPSFGHSLDIRA